MNRLFLPCSIADCGNLIWARGWCRKHYYRWHKHGDPLVTVQRFTPAGEPEAFLAALPECGNGCVIWPFARNNVGYAQINNPKRGKQLATRLVCEAAHGPAPSNRHVAAHECGKGHEGCVAPWHLSWKTPTENSADMDRHGTRSQGEQHHSKLTEAQVYQIRAIGAARSQSDVARDFGVSQTLVGRILRRKIWKHLPDRRAA